MIENVMKGVAWLDEHNPGWEREENINLKELNLLSCVDCILGQLFGEYFKGTEVGCPFSGARPSWEQKQKWAQERGFYMPEQYSQSSITNWLKLTDVWRNEIVTRRAAQD